MQRTKISKTAIKEGELIRIANYKLKLTRTPLEMKEEFIISPDKYYSTKEGEIRIHYVNACYEEGCFNIYLFHFSSGKCQIHCFGKMQGEDLHLEREVGTFSAYDYGRLNEALRFVITKSRMVLKSYYGDKDITSIMDHLTTFMQGL